MNAKQTRVLTANPESQDRKCEQHYGGGEGEGGGEGGEGERGRGGAGRGAEGIQLKLMRLLLEIRKRGWSYEYSSSLAIDAFNLFVMTESYSKSSFAQRIQRLALVPIFPRTTCNGNL